MPGAEGGGVRPKMPATVRCICGDEFPRHPALEIACSQCHAPIGKPCKRPSEHAVFRGSDGHALHAQRRKAAFEARPCSCLRKWEEAQRTTGQRAHPSLFDAEPAA